VLELPGCHKDCIDQLLKLRVPCLSILQDLTDKVHMLLFNFYHGFRPFNGDACTDNGVGSCKINTSLGFGGTSVDKDFRYYLSSMKATAA
jgi:hypothetical protein